MNKQKEAVILTNSKTSKKENGMRQLMKFLFSEYKWALLVVAVGIFATALVTVRGTLFIQSLIDIYILPLIGAKSPNFVPLSKALMKLAALYSIGIICSYVYNRIMVYVTQGSLKKIRLQLFKHMESLPIKYFDTHSHGDIMSLFTNDTDTLRQFIGQSLPQLLNSLISIVSVFISMLILNVPLTFIALFMVVIIMTITQKIAKYSRQYFTKQQKALGSINGYIEEMMSGQKVVKVFCHEQKSLEQFRAQNEHLRECSNKANGYANVLMPIVVQLGNVSYVICAVVGAVLALNGYSGLTIGTLISFMTLNKSFNQPIGQISQQVNSVVMAMAGIDRIFTLLNEEPEVNNGYVLLVNAQKDENGNLAESDKRTGLWAWKHYHESDGTTSFVELKGDIVLDGVDFGYDEEKMVLHDIKLFANEGQKLAFVGSTGAGKTTITNLINRFYDIQDGKIRYDGININKIKKADLRRSLGTVLQDTHLFTGTVMDNIRYGRLEATDEECIIAAKLANADSFIEYLPDKYNTMLSGDGSNLSQGQRQLLAIARAAVADPPVLILDEATSSIDTRTEELVQKGMDSLMKGRTTFVIAHRLSTVKNSDCIMVLEQGRIIERGNHEDLIAKKGRYYELYIGLNAS